MMDCSHTRTHLQGFSAARASSAARATDQSPHASSSSSSPRGAAAASPRFAWQTSRTSSRQTSRRFLAVARARADLRSCDAIALAVRDWSIDPMQNQQNPSRCPLVVRRSDHRDGFCVLRAPSMRRAWARSRARRSVRRAAGPQANGATW